MDRRIELAQWMEWVREGWSVLPYIIQYQGWAKGLPATWEKAWKAASPYAFVLESGKGGRYTYLGLNPVSVLTGKGLQGEITDLQTGEITKAEGKPLELLKNWMGEMRSPRVTGWPDFRGGCAGFLGYDVIRSLEELPVLAQDDAGFPDYLWMRMEEVWIYDHELQTVYCAVHTPWNQTESSIPAEKDLGRLYMEAAARATRMMEQWDDILGANEDEMVRAEERRRLLARQERAASLAGPDVEEWDRLTIDFSQENFERAVLSIQEYIRQGDVFQVNLSLRRHLKLHADPADVYEWLRLLNPSPYMGYIKSPKFALASGSPELLIKLNGNKVSARPIAGTRRRGAGPEEDSVMEAELTGNEKERAEHIMLVDLERNDIGRIAAYGTVHVPELMTVERYSHVMHLVSQVEGQLAEGKEVYDVIAATFPGGTITGAPKIRTMEIIEELEPVTRGPYTGSMGWIDHNGDMELNIIIRTLAVQDGTGYIQAGAGIVIDSNPYREYRECHNKAKALIAAVMCSEEEAAAAAVQ
ncbi:anthranilate synthase component I family protein [Paenibacillus dakarensis]|uniref:anthranilate synthase component I family protein n=1 Tax=Paenibacillus dakarensis TaxID=1527293 RepID=UPI0006D55F55|nr:anthranilate synthase component I family protein [Paenibacillus dakarensis]